MKKILYFFMGCIAIGLIVSTILSALPVFTMAGKGFLVATSQGQYEQSYGLLSQRFQQHYNLAAFTELMIHSGLVAYREVEWAENVTSPDKKSGYLLGVVLTKNNDRLLVKFNFVLESGKELKDKGWRIDSLSINNVLYGDPRNSPPTLMNSH